MSSRKTTAPKFKTFKEMMERKKPEAKKKVIKKVSTRTTVNKAPVATKNAPVKKKGCNCGKKKTQ
jgi:hypothetical protein